MPKSLLLFLLTILLFINKVSSQKFDAEVISYSTLCELGKDKLTETDSVIVQINNRSGDRYTDIEIPYSKGDKVPDIDGWIENMEGTKVRVLKKTDIVDKSAISDMSLYEDNFSRCFHLRYNIYPYRIIYIYKITYNNFIDIASWTPAIYDAIPTRSARLKVIIPKKIQFNKYVNRISDYHIDSTGSNLVLEWKAIYDKPVNDEIFSQPENFKSYVLVAPIDFKYGIKGSAKSWATFGDWQYNLIKDMDLLPNDEKYAITILIKGMTNKKEIVKTLYHYLQDNTRYINVSIGVGGLKPYPASYVAQNKYGDCKALSNYMRAVLSYAGIGSYYTNIRAARQPVEIIKNIAGPQFNHIVLAVPLDNDTIWLENTNNKNPFGYMGTSTQNREALLITSDNSRLVRIPALKTKDILVSYKFIFNLEIHEATRLTANISFRGSDFEYFNQLHSDFNDTDKDRIIRNYMPFDNYEVVNWELKKINRDTSHIELYANLDLNKFLKPLGNEYYFSLYPSRIPAFTPPESRTLPVVLPYPVCNAETQIYIMPPGYELKTKPDSINIQTQFGTYKTAISIVNGKILAEKRFELFPGSYSLEQYADLYSFIKSVKDLDKMKVIIKPVN